MSAATGRVDAPERTAAVMPVGGSGGPLRRIWRITRPPMLRLAAAVLLATGALTSAVGLLAVSAWLISRASQQPPILYLQVAIVAVRALGISRGALRYAERLVGHDAALRGLVNVRTAIYERLERLAPAGLGPYRRGDLLARLVGDVDTTMDLVVRVIVPAASAALAATAAVLIGWALAPAGGLVLLAIVVVAGFVAPAVSTAVGARSRAERAQAEGALSAELVAGLAAAPELRVLGGVDAALARIAAADTRITALDRRSALATGLGDALATLANGLGLVGVLLAGTGAVRSGSLDGVWLATLVLLPLALTDVLAGMPAAALARARVAGAAERILAVVDAPDPVPSQGVRGEAAVTREHLRSGAGTATHPPSAHPAPGIADPASHPPAPASATGGGHRVELNGVSARYPGTTADALSDLNLDLSAGRRIALVGASGSGKSTAVAVLLRLLDRRAGDHLLDGVDVRELPEEDVRAVVGAVDQQAHLFDTSIEENLRLARRGATPDELRAALEAVELADWVDTLPDGLATLVGPRGSHVSGGQAQRIALARVLLAERPIVLLDEPGEHLDAQMADRITATALSATAGRTVLLITHRPEHTIDCDEVIRLDAGRVVSREPRPA